MIAMNATGNKRNGFSKPRCSECGGELEREPSVYEAYEAPRLFCSNCKPIADVKRSWQPIGSGIVSRVFVVPDRKT